MLIVKLVPVIKNKAGKIGSMDNHIPIALASIKYDIRDKMIVKIVRSSIPQINLVLSICTAKKQLNYT